MASAEPVAASTDPSAVYEQLESYAWDGDAEFQTGLNAILQSAEESDRENIALRARCFFYGRKHNVQINPDEYAAWRSSQPASKLSSPIPTPKAADPAAAPPAANPTPAYPTSFQEIVKLITEGAPIPGIKEIPDTLLEGQASEQTASRRRKPWEKEAPSDST